MRKNGRRCQCQYENRNKRSNKNFLRRHWSQRSSGKYHEGGEHTKGGIEK